MKTRVLELYQWSILVGVTIGSLWLAYQLRDILILLFLVLIVSIALLPLVEYLETFKIPRLISVLGVIGVIVLAIIFLISNLTQSVFAEYESLSRSLIDNYTTLNQTYDLEQYFGAKSSQELFQQSQERISSYLQSQASQLVSLGASVFGVFLTMVTAVTLLFYLVYDPTKIKRFIVSFVPKDQKNIFWNVITQIEEKLAYWLQGQLFLMFIMGVISYIGFTIIGVEFALPLAVLVGVLDIIPVIGPIVAFIPAIVVSGVSSPIKALVVALFFIILQQLESNILVPKIMARSVGLDPVAVILALLAGSTIGGIIGAILAVPVAAIILIIYQEWQKSMSKPDSSDTILENPIPPQNLKKSSPLRFRLTKNLNSSMTEPANSN